MITRIARIRILFFAMAAFTLAGSTPCEQALAALTQSEETDARAFRERMSELLARQDVKEEFLRHGLDPGEARSRLDALTDSEIFQIRKVIGDLPPGGYIDPLAVYYLVQFTLYVLVVVIKGVLWLYRFTKAKVEQLIKERPWSKVFRIGSAETSPKRTVEVWVEGVHGS